MYNILKKISLGTCTLFFLAQAGTSAEFPSSIFADVCPLGCPIAVNNTPISIVVHKNYISGIDHKTKLSRWVAYSIKANNFGKRPKTHFKADPLLPNGIKLRPNAYKGMYKKHKTDRGHLAPAVTIARHNGYESFYLSNILPQHANLNRNIWKKIETKERALSGYVIAGAINNTDKSGNLLPSVSFWKIFIPNTKDKTFSSIVFFPLSKDSPHNTNAYAGFCYKNKPISFIEDMTGLKFFTHYTMQRKQATWEGMCPKTN